MAGWLQIAALLLTAFSVTARGQAIQFNNPPDVDIWCGKAYRSTNTSFNPGGQFEEPSYSKQPLLRLRARPRMNIYINSDSEGSLLIDAAISHQVGEPLDEKHLPNENARASAITVSISDGNSVLQNITVPLGSTNNEVSISLAGFEPSVNSHNVTVQAFLENATYITEAKIYRLPEPEGHGSVTRIDNLYGGISVLKDPTQANSTWERLFPYTYYAQWSLYWDANVSTLDEFASKGYNLIHIVPTGDLGDTPFPWDEFQPYLDRAAELGLYFQYDVLWTWTNLTEMIEQVTRLRTHPSIALWYQSDEPDGKGNPPNSTGIAYQQIRELDPYHPSSLALNCYDFYYEEYSAGGEIVAPDVYFISTNTSWSTVYDTPCNATYGCCGCDDCHGSLKDISGRLDAYQHRDDIIGWDKTHWFAPQAFGNESFWSRYPTAAEEVAMTIVSVNHNAKGITMWDYPTTDELVAITEKLAKTLTSEQYGDFVLGAHITQGLTVTGSEDIDAAIWVNHRAKTAMLSVVSMNYGNHNESISITLPTGVEASSVQQALWGTTAWTMEDSKVTASHGLLGLEVSIVILDLK